MTERLNENDLNPAAMTKRLLSGVSKLITAVERKMETEGVQAGDDDKTLNGLSRTLDTLFGVLRKAEAAQPVEVDGDRLRGELLTRLETWIGACAPSATAIDGSAA